MSLKIEFAERAEKGEPVARLCREYGISRTTGHKWLKRFAERGYEGLEEASRRPTSTPLATAEDVVLAVLAAREAHPRWGPRKLEVVLRRRLAEQTPSERTIARILQRANKVRQRRRRRPLSVVERAPEAGARSPNDVWTVDFKGSWQAANGQRCDPLTVRDAASRFVLAATLCRASTSAVRAVFEALFRKHGIPAAIQCDNGVPFVSVRSPGGLSSLSTWWVSLGIRLVRSRPACPQDNGGHERMHSDIAADVEARGAGTRQAQQRELDRWRQEFNHVRPHQALGGKTPAEAYRPTTKRPAEIRRYRYPSTMTTIRVFRNGSFRLYGECYFLSTSLAGMLVGLESVDALHLRVWLYDIDLGVIEVVPEVRPTLYTRTLSPRGRSLAA